MPGASASKHGLAVLAAGILLLVAGPPASAGPPETCGDGVEQPGEPCDDGNTASGDGCSPHCLEEICGDGLLEPHTEACDDGNTTAGDACAPDCTCEPEVCGDGLDGCLEECDDGNTVDGDGCDADCTVTVIIGVTSKAQQACVNAINKNLAGVIRAQNADNASCVKDVAAGKTALITDCLGDDVKLKVSKAQGKTSTTDGKKCNDVDEVPTFAYTAPATVNGAGRDEALEAANLVLGATPSIILKATDKVGAKCQGEIMKQLGAVSNKWAAEANKAKKTALKGKGATAPPVGSSGDLAAAIDTAIAARASLGRAETRATNAILARCDNVQANAAADCGGAITATQVAACVIAAAEEGACKALELADGLALDCPTVPVLP